ncbi:class I SAM-dependent methyltransferase [Paenibacillus allorhizosphaerae]|uniref:2-methoxy-6-polyprenyl-1,4-benzoquinol methylase, mitochondrial n=1 Tax=Paenibacillus allorhizosphaerae TaxID=2849866 RepID=A0ABM8VKG6_9BACL|nr:class I SAM-dependent methyltransferase [Paenibacillus allorhizosphaerae]CAG7646984.1 2-methoxy-6-polyprenyl-1,4-benzoquinol methylase, mitochondrial [Paenibacillus allorhizosphaerae]
MPNHTDIYNTQADTYEQLISKQRSLLDRIESVRPIGGLDVLDLGAGTGRFSAMLAPKARSLVALDASEAMLRVTAARLAEAGHANWRTGTADHRSLPIADNSIDLVVSGWSICYIASSNVPNWERNLQKTMDEIDRVLKKDGTVIIFETLGTGVEQPQPPDFLKAYYRQLEEAYGFTHAAYRTDYRFESPEEAERLTRFFFGDTLAEVVRHNRWSVVPECAGMWWRHRAKQ